MLRRYVLVLFLILHSLSPSALRADEKKPVRPRDYGRFERVGSEIRLSRDGKWAAVDVRRVDEERSLRLHAVDGSSERSFEHATSSRFSNDSAWIAFRITDPEKRPNSGEGRSSEKAPPKPPSRKLGLLRLGESDPVEIERVASFRFSDDGKFLAIERAKPEGRKVSSSDLIVRNLSNGRDTLFGNVASFSWSPEGALIAITIEADGKIGNGVHVFDARRATLRVIDSSSSSYHSATWRKGSFDLAVLRENTDAEKKKRKPHTILAWRDVRMTSEPKVFRSGDFDDFPDDLHVSRAGGLQWSDDGTILFVGLQGELPEASLGPRSTPGARRRLSDVTEIETGKIFDDSPEEKERPRSLRQTLREPAGVDVWHAKDVLINPLQRKTADRVKGRSILAAWHLDESTWTRIGSSTEESTRILHGQKSVVALDPRPYAREQIFGPTLRDVYVVDVRSGARRKILERLKFELGSSPDGRYFLYLKGGHFGVYDIEKNQHTSLMKSVEADFINDERNVLTDEAPPYGVSGWSKDSTHVFLNDKHDIWKIAVDASSATRVTRGAEVRVRHRRISFDARAEGDRDIDEAQPIYVQLFGERSKKSGLGRFKIGEGVERLVWADKRFSAPRKAREADVYAWFEERFDTPINIFTTGESFREPKQLTDLNSFLGEFAWGRAELVEFQSRRGDALQGALYYPAGYDPEKKYPMIVIIYETLSDNVHRFRPPSELNAYDTSVWTSEGYFVLQPDIVYRPQNPGLSAVDCVIPAVESILATGKIDPKRVGLVGHSWGGYQTAFLVTQTDVFSAGVAGAPLTNMMSMSMNVYWNSGQTNAWIFHESQGRMDRPFWRDIDTYVNNSPVFNIDRLDTPLLVAFGDKDGAVDWHQGIEMYNAARLAGKELVMLVYAGENHGLAKKPNRLDYHYRVLHWFDHYLKGDEAKKWVTDGISHLERERELEKEKTEKRKKETRPSSP